MNSLKKNSTSKAMAFSLGLGAVGVAMIVVSMTGFDVSVAQLKARGLAEIQRSELGKAEKTLKEALSRQELAKQESAETAEILLSSGNLPMTRVVPRMPIAISIAPVKFKPS